MGLQRGFHSDRVRCLRAGRPTHYTWNSAAFRRGGVRRSAALLHRKSGPRPTLERRDVKDCFADLQQSFFGNATKNAPSLFLDEREREDLEE